MDANLNKKQDTTNSVQDTNNNNNSAKRKNPITISISASQRKRKYKPPQQSNATYKIPSILSSYSSTPGNNANSGKLCSNGIKIVNYLEEETNFQNGSGNTESQDEFHFTMPDDVLFENDAMLALRSLITSYSAATYPPYLSTTEAIPFVLKPMLHHIFQSQHSHNTATAPAPPPTTSLMEMMMSSNLSTGLNIELQELCKQNAVRLIRIYGLDSGTSNPSSMFSLDKDEAIFRTHDYIRAVWDAHFHYASSSTSKTENEDDCSMTNGGSFMNHNCRNQDSDLHKTISSSSNENYVFTQYNFHRKNSMSDEEKQYSIQIFCKCLDSLTGTFCSHHDLLHSIIQQTKTATTQQSYHTPKAEIRVDLSYVKVWIDYFLSIHILSYRNDDKKAMTFQTSCGHGANDSSSKYTTYWFTLPNLSKASRFITNGRKKMKSYLKRTYHKELKYTVLQSMNMGNDTMLTNFHIKDLLSCGLVEIKHTSSGDFVKLIDY